MRNALLLTVSATLLWLVLVPRASADTFYVRPDGGSATQCTGRADAPYPGEGTGQPCAWSHPFWALPPAGGSSVFAGGDTLVVADGSYRMGYGAPNTDGCSAVGSYDCTAAPVPSGPDADHPTRILGAGASSGCVSKPELWGTERVWHVLDLSGSSNVEVACFEITDHAGCIESHSGDYRCERDSAPYGPWASAGIVASDSANVALRHLDVHGLAHTGIRAGRLRDWLVEDVRIAHNGWVGWDGDLPAEDDSNAGTLTFRRWVVEWNGCGESWPEGETVGCWGQSAGGYGDGVGTGATGGRWVIEDSRFMHNTSDGLDLLYLTEGTEVILERVHAEGNAGNQIKTKGATTMRNSLVVGNCGFFEGKSFTHHVDPCRAFGNAVSLGLRAGTEATLVNNTIVSEGDCALLLGGDGCDGSEHVLSRNNVVYGLTDFHQPSERTCFAYTECPGDPLDHDYGVIHGVKSDPCPVGGNDLCADPRFERMEPPYFDLRLAEDSPARDTGSPVGGAVPAVDFRGHARPAGGGVDRGAYEMGSEPAPDAGPAVRPDAGTPRDASVASDGGSVGTVDGGLRTDAGLRADAGTTGPSSGGDAAVDDPGAGTGGRHDDVTTGGCRAAGGRSSGGLGALLVALGLWRARRRPDRL